MNTQEMESRLKWFREARFGMFVHWGLYSLLGRGEWVMSRESIPWPDYQPLASRFEASSFDPANWAQTAKRVGMKYVVLTAKHHEGFCLWNSKHCSFNAVNSAARRDLFAEYVTAVRAAGLKVGVYYSLGDWHNPDWLAGMRGDENAKNRFIHWTHEMVCELMFKYGTIDILWYDLPQGYSAEEWRSVELNAKVRRLQPGILINNRAMTGEDFATPEQHAAASLPGRAWECCMTLNNHWGYCPHDRNFKSPTQVALLLAYCAANDGNLLLNVGPDGQGAIPPESMQILDRVGTWIEKHHAALFRTRRNDLMWYLFGPTTVKDNKLFCFLQNHYGSELCMGGLKNLVLSATLLETGGALKVEQIGRQTFIRGIPPLTINTVLPVIQLELDSPAAHDLSEAINGADIMPKFPQ